MGKIGIITFHKAVNYGAVLQSYALYQHLESSGADVELIDYDGYVYSHYNESSPGNVCKKYVKRLLYRNEKKKKEKFAKFVKKFIPTSESRYTNENFAEISGYDVIITGSDQVWNPNIIGDDLSFLLYINSQDIKRYSYAASIGLENLPGDIQKRYADIWKKYNGISVREASARKILHDSGIKNVQLVCDPTLLLKKEQWSEIEEKVKTPKKYILVFMFGADTELWQAACSYAETNKCEIVTVNDSPFPIKRIIQLGGLGIQEWIYLFHHAECVFTNSYHGMIFSVIFQRDFWVSDPGDGTNSRIEELLKLIDCKNREMTLASNIDLKCQIDYSIVAERLKPFVSESKSYLSKVLSLENITLDTGIVSKVTTENKKCVTFDKKCTGCTACMTVCPRDAIMMIPNAKGSYFPVVDEDKCTDCSLCIKLCPLSIGDNGRKITFEQEYYAYKSKNRNDIKKCSSGGIFLAIARKVIDDGGVVYGVVYDEHHNVIYGKAENEHELMQISGTKYIESEKQEIFARVIEDLKTQKTVLFTGTPCTIAGIKAAVPEKFANKLITMDIICHGVPSPTVYRSYLSFLEGKYRSRIVKINFRDKVYAERFHTYIHTKKIRIDFENGDVYHGYNGKDPYWHLFWSNCILRESCYSCKYATLERISDITIGDYWGDTTIAPEFFSEHTESSVIINTEIGKKLFTSIADEANVLNVNKEAIMQRNLHMPTLKSPKYNGFWNDYMTHSFKYVLFRYADYYGVFKLIGKFLRR